MAVVNARRVFSNSDCVARLEGFLCGVWAEGEMLTTVRHRSYDFLTPRNCLFEIGVTT